MRATHSLLQNLRLTLFTRSNCGLCDTAKRTVQQLQQRKPFVYSEMDIMVPENKAWKDVYEFDVPVLHVQKSDGPVEELSEATKLFHRFTDQEVEQAMAHATKSS